MLTMEWEYSRLPPEVQRPSGQNGSPSRPSSQFRLSPSCDSVDGLARKAIISGSGLPSLARRGSWCVETSKSTSQNHGDRQRDDSSGFYTPTTVPSRSPGFRIRHRPPRRSASWGSLHSRRPSLTCEDSALIQQGTFHSEVRTQISSGSSSPCSALGAPPSSLLGHRQGPATARRESWAHHPARRQSTASVESKGEDSPPGRSGIHRSGCVAGSPLSPVGRILSFVQSTFFHALKRRWTPVSHSVWRVILSVLGTCACWSGTTWFFTLVGVVFFFVFKAYTTSPPLAVFPVYFDYIPALSEALSKSAFPFEDSTTSYFPQRGGNDTITEEFCSATVSRANSTESLCAPFFTEKRAHESRGVDGKVSSAPEANPLQRHPSALHTSSVLPVTCVPPLQSFGCSQFVQAPNAFSFPCATEGVWSDMKQKNSFSHLQGNVGESLNGGSLPFFLFPAPSSVAIAAVPFSNRSWEFIPLDTQMYVPPSPLSQIAKSRGLRHPVSSPASTVKDSEGLPASFFVNLDKSRLPKDHHLDVSLTLSYPWSDHNRRLPPVMFSVVLFTPDHRPIAKATRPLLTSGVAGDAGGTTGLSGISFSSFDLLSTVTYFAPAFLRDRLLGLAGSNIGAASIVFFESFPLDLIPHLKYAQVLMYPPLHVSNAGLIMAPKLHGFRLFLASHWAIICALVTLFLLCCCALCTCCAAVGCTYLAFSVSSSEDDTELPESRFHARSRAPAKTNGCGPSRSCPLTSFSDVPLPTHSPGRASKISKSSLAPGCAGYQSGAADVAAKVGSSVVRRRQAAVDKSSADVGLTNPIT
ncbi:transmembrane protein [Cystoisospora suis]|uniref:Transmembrane protein n=1 Tax=Cystoisospora suis TaxID=483139 RepID=A0A2C6KWI0_9APIC|nr:transmembrane protein [Cystoisospora suis]